MYLSYIESFETDIKNNSSPELSWLTAARSTRPSVEPWPRPQRPKEPFLSTLRSRAESTRPRPEHWPSWSVLTRLRTSKLRKRSWLSWGSPSRIADKWEPDKPLRLLSLFFCVFVIWERLHFFISSFFLLFHGLPLALPSTFGLFVFGLLEVSVHRLKLE